jgi:hypothetical protein
MSVFHADSMKALCTRFIFQLLYNNGVRVSKVSIPIPFLLLLLLLFFHLIVNREDISEQSPRGGCWKGTRAVQMPVFLQLSYDAKAAQAF